MNPQVPASVLKSTTECPSSFSCLSTGKCGEREMCAAEYANGYPVLVLKKSRPAACPYRMAYSDRQVCLCPTHFALHKARHGI